MLFHKLIKLQYRPQTLVTIIKCQSKYKQTCGCGRHYKMCASSDNYLHYIYSHCVKNANIYKINEFSFSSVNYVHRIKMVVKQFYFRRNRKNLSRESQNETPEA